MNRRDKRIEQRWEFDEILNMIKVKTKDQLELAWDKIDQQKNGQVNKEQLYRGLRRLGVYCDKKQVDILFSKLSDFEDTYINFYQVYIKWQKQSVQIEG